MGAMANDDKILILIKPDAVKRGLTGEVLARIERKGYKLENIAWHNATPEQLAAHYVEHVEKPFYPLIVEYMTSGPIVAAIYSGSKVIEGVRSLAGATDPTTAAPGTIRGDYGRDWANGNVENILHASDSLESAEREIAIWFA